MLKNRFIFFVLFVLFVSSLFAVPFDMILTGDPVLEDLLFLSRESGKPILSFTPPISPGEIEVFLNKIDVSLLTPPAREAYYRVQDRLTPKVSPFLAGDFFSMSLGVSSTLEATARFNPDISWYPEHPKIPALLSLPLKFYFSDLIQIYMEVPVVKEQKYYPGDNSFGINIPFAWYQMDQKYPLRAFIAAGGSWWNFQLGRDRLSYGTAHTGSLSISDNPESYEFARILFFSKYFKYSLLLNQMPLEVPDELYNEMNDSFHARYPDEPDILRRSNQRYYYLHRIDFGFRDIFSLALMEGVMVGNSAPELRFLNPLIIFHHFYSWHQYNKWTHPDSTYDMNGSFFSVEANWNIIKSLSVYGQFFMNELATTLELGDNPDQPPNGMGCIAGINYTHSFTNWASSFFFEAAYTDPYAYMNPSPFASFIHNISKLEQVYYFIGYPRDTIAFTLGGKLFKGDALSISAEFSRISQGEHTIAWDWEKSSAARGEKTPSGIAETKYVASVEAQWKPLSYLSFKGGLTGIVSRNNNHISGSDEIGGQASLSVSFKL